MGTVSDVVREARSHLGYTESPPGSNRTRFGQWAGRDGEPWCGMFVDFVFDRAGVKLPGAQIWTPGGAASFKRDGRWRKRPRRGDVVYMDFNGDGVIQHVGIVVSAKEWKTKGNVFTIEGNTSGGIVGSQDNGGMVARRIRNRRQIVGFGRPRYGRRPRNRRVLATSKGGRVRVVRRQKGGGFTFDQRKATGPWMSGQEAGRAARWARSRGCTAEEYGRKAKYPFLLLNPATKWPTDKRLLRQLNKLARRLERRIEIRSGLRTRAQQEELYRRFRAGLGPLAAVPGTSLHETGRAADCGVITAGGYLSIGNHGRAYQLMPRFGLCLPVASEAWHVQVGDDMRYPG